MNEFYLIAILLIAIIILAVIFCTDRDGKKSKTKGGPGEGPNGRPRLRVARAKGRAGTL